MSDRAVEGAWDGAEKVLADLGVPWDLVRFKDHFWLDTGWARISVNARSDGVFFRVSQKQGGSLLQWDCRGSEALTFLLDLLWAR